MMDQQRYPATLASKEETNLSLNDQLFLRSCSLLGKLLSPCSYKTASPSGGCKSPKGAKNASRFTGHSSDRIKSTTDCKRLPGLRSPTSKPTVDGRAAKCLAHTRAEA